MNKLFLPSKGELSLPINAKTPISTLIEEVDHLNKNKSLPTEERWTRFSELMSRFFAVGRDLLVQTAAPVAVAAAASSEPPKVKGEPLSRQLYVGKTADEDRFKMIMSQTVETMPVSLRNKTLQLLQYLGTQNTALNRPFGFNADGHLVVQGKVMHGSNFIDLIHHTIRKRPRKNKPLGFILFRKVLEDMNVPTELISTPLHERTEASAAGAALWPSQKQWRPLLPQKRPSSSPTKSPGGKRFRDKI